VGAAELPLAAGAVDAADHAVAQAEETGPADARTREQFDWLAEEVAESGGQAGVWLARPGTTSQERELAAQMAAARAVEYAELESAVAAAAVVSGSARAGALRRLRGQWRQITRRDFFPPPERERARAALRAVEATSDEMLQNDAEEVSP
jgi:hypothetical protein